MSYRKALGPAYNLLRSKYYPLATEGIGQPRGLLELLNRAMPNSRPPLTVQVRDSKTVFDEISWILKRF